MGFEYLIGCGGEKLSAAEKKFGRINLFRADGSTEPTEATGKGGLRGGGFLKEDGQLLRVAIILQKSTFFYTDSTLDAMVENMLNGVVLFTFH